MPVKGYRAITISEETYRLLQAIKQVRERELGHKISINALLIEILREYNLQTQVVE